MASKRSDDTTPDHALRRRLHARGLRFARGARALPGQPDIVLPRRRSVIFVRSCFWHGHGCAIDRAAARFKAGTWAQEIAANQARDAQDQAALREAGWQVEVVWECQAEQPAAIDRLAERLLRR